MSVKKYATALSCEILPVFLQKKKMAVYRYNCAAVWQQTFLNNVK